MAENNGLAFDKYYDNIVAFSLNRIIQKLIVE